MKNNIALFNSNRLIDFYPWKQNKVSNFENFCFKKQLFGLADVVVPLFSKQALLSKMTSN